MPTSHITPRSGEDRPSLYFTGFIKDVARGLCLTLYGWALSRVLKIGWWSKGILPLVPDAHFVCQHVTNAVQGALVPTSHCCWSVLQLPRSDLIACQHCCSRSKCDQIFSWYLRPKSWPAWKELMELRSVQTQLYVVAGTPACDC